MAQSTLPLSQFTGALERLRNYLQALTPEGQLATASGLQHPYQLHNFKTLKTSFFPGSDDDLVAMAKATMPDGQIPGPEDLKADTIQAFVEILIAPSFGDSCGAVYDSDDPQGAQAKSLSDFAGDIADIQASFEAVLVAEEWPNQAKLWTSSGATAVSDAIAAGTK